MINEKNTPLSVTEINQAIKSCLEDNFEQVVVEGEVSNFSLNFSGHSYFTLSDVDSSISCAVFKMDVLRNPILKTMKNGDKIIIWGSLNLYPKKGTIQIVGKRVYPAGVGTLMMQFEMLKNKLQAQGYFDVDKKKRIPQFPKKIAIITALQGAALQDFLNIIKRRSFHYHIVIIPALVQGDEAYKSLIQGLNKAENIPELELIVLARGGGSQEDLWAFNHEELVKQIFHCKIPTISAVGHQVDVTLSDLVADLRAETPSAAAEMISGPQKELKNTFISYKNLFLKKFLEFQRQMELRLKKINPNQMLKKLWAKLQESQETLSKYNLKYRIHDLTQINNYYQRIDDAEKNLLLLINNQLTEKQKTLDIIDSSLNALNPKKVLKRGYSIVQNDEGHIVKNMKEFQKLSAGSIVKINFSDGEGRVKKV